MRAQNGVSEVVRMWKAKIRFWDGKAGEKFEVEIGAGSRESLRKQVREEIKAYTREGYEFLGVKIEQEGEQ